jgi:superfamily II DNA or RNA helicase/CRISPR/Cas system-associated exonuclease Cas4 (RecB family)
MIQFNISASSLGLYEQSQLLFYYGYLIKAEPDTKVNEVYGKSGRAVHSALERYIIDKTPKELIEGMFIQEWQNENLHIEKGFNNQPLNYQQYYNCVRIGTMKLDLIYSKFEQISEKEIILPFIDNEKYKINLKGYIDLILRNEKEVVLVDWKTSSKISNNDEFRTQALMYFYLYYKKFNEIPTKIIFEYLKLNKTKEYKFNLDELKEFEIYLNKIVNEIMSKGDDIKQYSMGEWNTPFNEQFKKCEIENNRRLQTNIINVIIENNRLKFNKVKDEGKIIGELPENLKNVINKKYQYKVEGAEWTQAFQSGKWDGLKRFYTYESLPIGFINDLKVLVKDYNEHYHTEYELNLIDKRLGIVNQTFTTKFKKSNIKLRPYQKDTIEKMIQNKIGIMYMGTGLGKTLTTLEMVKQLNTRTLFVVNRLELIDQVYEDMIQMYPEDTDKKIGKMSEGNLDCYNQITIASVQTMNAILKRKNKESKDLIKYLFNVNCLIWDECQGLSDSTFYSTINKYITNANYLIGLTGTPFRADEKTLEMNSLVGFPVVEYSTEWGEQNGYLCPTKCYFINFTHDISKLDTSYNNNYEQYITSNIERNEMIKEITEKFKDKKIIILTRIIEHATKLKEMIPDAIVINSKTDIKTRRKDFDKFKTEKNGIMIAGIKIMSAGINIPDLDIIINATANMSAIDTIQSIGRTKRIYPGKTHGYYIDFYDRSSNFIKASKARKSDLEKFGNKTEIIDNVNYIL